MKNVPGGPCSCWFKNLNDAEDDDVVKKVVYDELVKQINAIPTIDTSNLVKK